MNERIKQIKHQASLWCDINIPEQFSDHGYGKAWEDKFAELIVQECINSTLEQKKWVENQVVFNPRDEAWNLARIQQSQRIIDKIKEHFGVEE